MTTGYEEFNKIEDEVLDRQPFVKFTPILEEKALDIYKEIKTGVLKIAIEKTYNIKTYTQIEGYQELIGAKLPLDKSLLEYTDEADVAEAKKVDTMLKDIRGEIMAGNIYEANVIVDQVKDILQKRVKINRIREAITQVQDNESKDPIIF
jgi:soluble cytochrome b562